MCTCTTNIVDIYFTPKLSILSTTCQYRSNLMNIVCTFVFVGSWGTVCSIQRY